MMIEIRCGVGPSLVSVPDYVSAMWVSFADTLVCAGCKPSASSRNAYEHPFTRV